MADPIYLAAHGVEAQIVQDYLAAHGVRTTVLGRFAGGGVGELPFPETYPRLLLVDERDRARAQALLREYERSAVGAARACPACGERSPEHFAVCWNCQARL